MAGIFLMPFGYWFKRRSIGPLAASAYAMEHVTNLKYKISNNLIVGLDGEEKKAILDLGESVFYRFLCDENAVSNLTDVLTDRGAGILRLVSDPFGSKIPPLSLV